MPATGLSDDAPEGVASGAGAAYVPSCGLAVLWL